MAKQVWLLEIAVEDNWVADGFELTKLRAKEMILDQLPFANETEVRTRILREPQKKIIHKLQGRARANRK